MKKLISEKELTDMFGEGGKEEVKEAYKTEIQVCSLCGKVDVSKNDRHICDRKWNNIRQQNKDY